jgi:hypothetical protein
MKILRTFAAIVASLLHISCQPATPLSSPLDSPLESIPQHQVSGYLFRSNDSSPVRKIKLFAATLSVSQDGYDIYVVDPATTPSSFTDEEGFFYFNNLPIGKYALVADVVLARILLEDDKSKAILFEIKDEKTTVFLGRQRVKFDLTDGV